MKIRILPFLSVLFALPVCSAFATSTLDSITNATDADGALSAYDSETSRLLSEYKSKLTDTEYKEIESLIKKHRNKYDKTDTDESQETDTDSEKDNESDVTTDKAQETESGLRKPTAEEQKEIDELKDNATAMKDKEQSTANKLIGAAGIGATGIGGMMLASGLAEQSADTDAETAMRAYLETFYCKIGENGSSVKGGTMGAIVPGGNELINLYSEYVNLANGLKTRKSALNLLPGIESEAILDSATSGLYDDIYTGKTGGAYASLARALQNPNGEDAKRWAEQKQKSSDDVKTGAITAGVGAAGSLIANLAVNAKSEKERSDEIKKKYANMIEELESEQEKLDQIKPTAKCPSGASGTFPECSCTNKIYDLHTNTCIACKSGETIKDNQCISKTCSLTGHKQDNACECIENAFENQYDECECDADAGYIYNENTKQCILHNNTPKISDGQILLPLHISSDTSFTESYSTTLNTVTQKNLKNISKVMKDNNISADDTCLHIVGHTDRIPWKKEAKWTNQTFSAARAKAVEKILNENNIKNTKTYGAAAATCTSDKYEKPNDAECRRIDIIITAGKCDSDTNAKMDLTEILSKIPSKS